MKKLLTILFASVMLVGACIGFSACGNSSDYNRILEKGTLVVGVTVYKPMDYLDENDEWTGFDAEIAEMMAEEWGVKAQFVIINWANKVAELNSKAIDVVWNGMTASDELGQQIDFSVAYAENRQVAVIKTENAGRINSLEAVKASSIAVERESAGDTVATEEIQGSNISRVAAQVDAVLEVDAGTSETAIIDYTMAKSVVGEGEFADLTIVDPDVVSFEREVFAVGLRKGSDLTEKINALYKKYYEDGTLEELADKYKSVVLNTEELDKL